MNYDPNTPYEQGQPQPPFGQPGQPPTQYTPPPQYQQGQPPYGQPQPPYGQYGQQPPYGQPPYGQPQYGGMPPNYGQPPQKRSLRWLWITLAIVGGLVVLICGGCTIASVAGVGWFASTVAGPTATANSYYQAIKGQDYAKAYTYLDTSGVSVAGQSVTQDAFVKLAQLDDTAQGPVTNFTQTGVNVTNDTATVTMSVTRRSTYTVELQMKKVGNDWKIVAANNV